jgi:hypothetical protein
MSQIGYKRYANCRLPIADCQVVSEKSAIGNWKSAIFHGFVTAQSSTVSMQSGHSPGINKDEL